MTGIAPPPRDTERERRQAATLWWQPLRQLPGLVDGDVAKAEQLMTEAWERLDGKVTVSSPKSLLNTAIAIAGEWHRNGGSSDGVPVVTF